MQALGAISCRLPTYRCRAFDGRAFPPQETRLSISNDFGRLTAKFAMIARYLRNNERDAADGHGRARTKEERAPNREFRQNCVIGVLLERGGAERIGEARPSLALNRFIRHI